MVKLKPCPFCGGKGKPTFKDCIYCEFEQREYMYHGSDRYICKHRDGLPRLPELSPMDYCSRGVATKEDDLK